MDLWYHGIALVGFGVAQPAARYDPRYAFDVRLAATGRLMLRAGCNYIPAERTMINLPAPAIVKHHLTAGGGFQAMPVGIQAGYYHAFREHHLRVTPHACRADSGYECGQQSLRRLLSRAV